MGDYGVSIIHINSSTIAISIVEPQNDADTFINSCGETGERPAIRVMITIHDARATVRLTDIDEEVRNITIDVTYSDNEDGFNFYKIILALAKQKVDDLIKDSAKDALFQLTQFASYNGIATKGFDEVIKTAKDWAKTKGMNIVDFLNEYK